MSKHSGFKLYLAGGLALYEHKDCGLWSLHSLEDIILDKENILSVLGYLSDKQLTMLDAGADLEQVRPYTEQIELINTRIL